MTDCSESGLEMENEGVDPILETNVKEESVDVDGLDVTADPVESSITDSANDSAAQMSIQRPRRQRRPPRNLVEDMMVPLRSDPNYEAETDVEMEIESDLQMIQRQRVKRQLDYADFGPVQWRFDSTQRKKQVIVFNSVKSPGHASEWYFARKNNTTLNETYRCVQCRRYREEIKRGNRDDNLNRPEARIIVQMDRFLTNPDEPLGDHICDFENNERTMLHNVWSRRALSKANSELRLHPEKPKVKFDKLIEEVRAGGEYVHLERDVREKIVDELINSKKGFASRRRSFARNNRIALTNPIKLEQGYSGGLHVMHYLCGMPKCSARFITHAERVKHRMANHPTVIFIDSNEELKQYNEFTRLNRNVVRGEELIVADEQEVITDGRAQAGTNVDVVHYEVINVDQEESMDHNEFLDQIDILLGNIRQFVGSVAYDPDRRQDALDHLNNMHNYFEEMSDLKAHMMIPADEGAEEIVDQ